ncbi:ThiF family adenylyltransferase [Streptomyces griseofuscus]|uniref:ThiF family adenylyltransferase n=1 Tax=Streptomyces griseofuscus TaxID=146922 RepID=UPI003452CF45
MARRPVNPPAEGWSLTIPPRLWADLSKHVIEASGGAVLLAGLADGPRGPRLLARDLIPAQKGTDYVRGEVGHHALAPAFVRDAVLRARDEQSAYIAVHAHGGLNQVGFSRIDLDSHARGYPSLLQISRQIVGALVLTPHAAAGDLWLPDGGRATLAETVVPGGNLLRLRSIPADGARPDPQRDRQARLFGDLGQETLRRLRVAVVGLGGVGSILVEGLARLGVGELVLIDDDTVDPTNLARLIAAEPDDPGRPKTRLAIRNARRANPEIRVTTLSMRAEDPEASRQLALCDWIFLAADGDAARYVVNATAHQYLIPATQAGVKVIVSTDGSVGQIHTATRLITPGASCLWCSGLIDPTRLAVDLQPATEREVARYVPGVPAPSVITLNSLAAAEALNHFALAVTDLHEDGRDHAAVIHRPRTRQRDLQNPRQLPACRWCNSAGWLGRGLRKTLADIALDAPHYPATA